MSPTGKSFHANHFGAIRVTFQIALTVLYFTIAASGQTLQSIHSFNYSVSPNDLTLGIDGNFYGTTSSGGNGFGMDGTFFQVTMNGTLTTLVSFDSADGANPGNLALGNDGNFYCTTRAGGVITSTFADGMGMIFKVTTNGTLTALASFNFTNGANPESLTLGNDGNFYGTTAMGGTTNFNYTQGMGTIFQLTTNGTLTTLASFNFTNGANPGSLTLGNDGNFYGTTAMGGTTNPNYTQGMGTIFQVTTNGTLTRLASFNFTNGANPNPLTLGNDGNFYGTTGGGSLTNSVYPQGVGTIFQVTTNGTLTTLALFSFTNGANPGTLILGHDGNFYGTTRSGGLINSQFPAGVGTIFQLTTNGTLATLLSFNSANGANPGDLTIGNDGNFYGTTWNGGTASSGTIFRFLLALAITVQPHNQTANIGGNTAFTVAAISPQYLTYQWQVNSTNLTNGGNISGATNSTLTITDISSNDLGIYSVIVTSGESSVLSSNATLTVAIPPSIITQPTNMLVLAATNVAFGVSASGTPPFDYQWVFNNTALLNATNSFYAITSVGASNAGIYSVVVNNQAGGISSSNATLTAIFSPTSRTNNANTVAAFTAPSFGPASLNYQWQKNGINLTNGANISGATNITLTVASVTDTDAASYSAVVSDPNSALTTSNAILTVIDPPIITAQPTNLLVLAGANVAFSVFATGTPPLSYQWLFNNTNLAGATNSSYTFSFVGTNNAGNYSILITNVAQSVISSNAALTVVLSPTNATNYAGSTATFTLTAISPGFLNVKWQKNGIDLANGANISGATNNTLTVTDVSDADAANYAAVVSDPYSHVNTLNATLTVIDLPTITTQPTNLLVLPGTNVALSVNATGTPPLHYQWLFNNTNILNATNAIYTISSVGITNAGNYEVLITNVANSILSSNASLTVVLSPTNQTNYASSTAMFTVTTFSSETLKYQWQKNGANLTNAGNISGATNKTLTIATLSNTDAAGYTAVVSDEYTSVATSNAVLTVIDTLVDMADPQNQAVLQGQNVTFNFTVYGAPPYLFQWYFEFGGSPISSTVSQTNVGSITLTNVGLSQEGYYQAEVINADGTLWSSYAYLTVIVPPTLSLQLASGYPLLHLNGMLGYDFVVQYNTNLATTNWINLLSITNLQSSPYQFLDPSGFGQPARFYRTFLTQ